jgi:hypothetical protein
MMLSVYIIWNAILQTIHTETVLHVLMCTDDASQDGQDADPPSQAIALGVKSIFEKIFSLLDQEHQLQILPLVCKAWHDLVPNICTNITLVQDRLCRNPNSLSPFLAWCDKYQAPFLSSITVCRFTETQELKQKPCGRKNRAVEVERMGRIKELETLLITIASYDKLRSFTVHGPSGARPMPISMSLSSLTQLSDLCLSACALRTALEAQTSLLSLTQLHWLDLSYSRDETPAGPSQLIPQIASNLTQLTALDISCSSWCDLVCIIANRSSYVYSPLEYLGGYDYDYRPPPPWNKPRLVDDTLRCKDSSTQPAHPTHQPPAAYD